MFHFRDDVPLWHTELTVPLRALKFSGVMTDIYVRSVLVDQMFGLAVLSLSFALSLGAARAILGILVGGLGRRG
jgi:hypothetical protein